MEEHLGDEFLLVFASSGLGLGQIYLQVVEASHQLGDFRGSGPPLGVALPLVEHRAGLFEVGLGFPLGLGKTLTNLRRHLRRNFVQVLRRQRCRSEDRLLDGLLGLGHFGCGLLLEHDFLAALCVPLERSQLLNRELVFGGKFTDFLETAPSNIGHELPHNEGLRSKERPGFNDELLHRLRNGLRILDGTDCHVQRKQLVALQVRRLRLRCLLESVFNLHQLRPAVLQQRFALRLLACLACYRIHLVDLLLVPLGSLQ
mmetsp:Transcript_62037/g.173158  ORF Transcript_62037/g.173158 Transcript_62037/m.173158 type:complete len:258 (-) Transcript_62037:38-811(-)